MTVTVSSLTEFFAVGTMTRQEVADRAGITRTYLSMIENGHRRIPLPLALKIRDLTGVPIESLVPRTAA